MCNLMWFRPRPYSRHTIYSLTSGLYQIISSPISTCRPLVQPLKHSSVFTIWISIRCQTDVVYCIADFNGCLFWFGGIAVLCQCSPNLLFMLSLGMLGGRVDDVSAASVTLSRLASWAWHVTPLPISPGVPRLLIHPLSEKGRSFRYKKTNCI